MSRLDEIRERDRKRFEANKPTPLNPPQSCTVCGEPATNFYNIAMIFASSAPSTFEPRCPAHGFVFDVYSGVHEDIAYLLSLLGEPV